jgi:AraC-like DNA-binding protein
MSDAIPPLRVLNGAFTICSPEWSWSTLHPPLGWRGCILWNVLSGKAELAGPEGSIEAGPGRILLLDVENADYEGWTTQRQDMALQWIHFRLRSPAGGKLRPVFEVQDAPFWEAVFSRVIRRIRGPGQVDAPAHAWLRAALWELVQAQPLRPPCREQRGPRQADIQQLCQEIEQRPGHRWNIAEMARRTNLSPTHLSRLFKQMRNIPPGAFVIRTRIRLAKHHLRLSNTPLSVLAEKLGYCDPFAFSRQFKKVTGQSPSQYRRLSQL